MLDIVPSYNPVQYQGKLMMQTWKNAEVLILNPKNHPIKFKGKLMNQTWENVKKPNLELNFDLFGPNILMVKTLRYGFVWKCNFPWSDVIKNRQ